MRIIKQIVREFNTEDIINRYQAIRDELELYYIEGLIEMINLSISEDEEMSVSEECETRKTGYYTICITDGYREFKSQRACARYYGISQATLNRACYSRRPIEINGREYYFISIMQNAKLC